jgi:2-polyprenyl-3-methyl-5-hydroxy-6-metoxy-1,4-benzoquinol methylase
MALPEICPLCAAKPDAQRVVTAHVYGAKQGERAFFHCSNCDVRYMHPGLTPEEEARFYAAEFEGFMAGRAGPRGGWSNVEEHIRANEPTRVRRMSYLKPYLDSGARVLEVGCSSGFMLFPLIASGFDCTGVEPSGVFSDHLRSRGLAVHASLDELPAAGSRFDVVMHFFVLEHIAQARAFLERQLTLLKPGGKLIFEIPNAADPLYSIYDIPEFERFYWSIAHPWYFSESSLRHLLEQVGRPYGIKRDQRYDLSNHIVWARDGRPGGMGRFSEKLGAEVEASYKQGLIRSGLCDTLVGIVSNE